MGTLIFVRPGGITSRSCGVGVGCGVETKGIGSLKWDRVEPGETSGTRPARPRPTTPIKTGAMSAASAVIPGLCVNHSLTVFPHLRTPTLFSLHHSGREGQGRVTCARRDSTPARHSGCLRVG